MGKNLDGSSDNPAGKTSTDSRKILVQCTRRIKKSDFFFKQNFSNWSYAHVGSSFHNPAKKFSSEGWKFFAHFWQKKTKTPTIFSKNLIFFKSVLSTRRFQFRQSCSKYSDKTLKKFAQKTKLLKNKYIFLKKTFVKMFLGTRRIQFLQQKKLCSLSKNDREFFFQKILLKIDL